MLDDKDESAIWDDEWVTWAAIAKRRADENRQWFAGMSAGTDEDSRPESGSAAALMD